MNQLAHDAARKVSGHGVSKGWRATFPAFRTNKRRQVFPDFRAAKRTRAGRAKRRFDDFARDTLLARGAERVRSGAVAQTTWT